MIDDHDAGDQLRAPAAIGTLTVSTSAIAADRRHAGRQHVPDEHVLDGEHGVGRRGDAARQHAGQPVGEIARRMPGQVAEQVAPQIAGDADEGVSWRSSRRRATADCRRRSATPSKRKGDPDAGVASPLGEHVDQILDAVLRADRTGDRGQALRRDDGMGDGRNRT